MRTPSAKSLRRLAKLAAPALLAAAAACGRGSPPDGAAPEPAAPEQAAPVQAAPPAEAAAPVTRALPGSLAWAAGGGWRLPEERMRDASMHRLEIAELFGLDAASAVLELAPGSGAWTGLVAPATHARGGRYVAAVMPADAGRQAGTLAERFAERFSDADVFGAIEVRPLGPDTPPLAEPGTIDAAFSVDDVATWMALGYAEKAFADAYAALAPGGRLGVIQPRAPAQGAQDPGASSGYVQQDYVVRLAEEAGFRLESASELLANPADTADHPFGVWTLAPYRLTAPLGAPADPGFDRAPYDAVGEPDRMVLVFRKPRRSE